MPAIVISDCLPPKLWVTNRWRSEIVSVNLEGLSIRHRVQVALRLQASRPSPETMVRPSLQAWWSAMGDTTMMTTVRIPWGGTA